MIQDFLINTFETRKPTLYSVSNVPEGFRYWFLKLLNFMLSIIEYGGDLPESITSRDLELCFILQGYATPFYNNKGNPVCVPTSLYGYNENGKPVKGVFGNPLIPSKRLFFEDIYDEDGYLMNEQNAVLMYNMELHNNIFFTQIDGSFRPMLCRYARRLADIESTENAYTIKLRMGSAPVAGDDAVNASITKWIRKIMRGDLEGSIADDSVLNSFRSVDIGNGSSKETLMSIQTARDKILEQFFREIGVKSQNPKKAQVTEEESSADEQLLLLSPEILLQERQKGIEAFNKFFGTNVTVRINPVYDRKTFTEKGEKDNGSKSSEEIY